MHAPEHFSFRKIFEPRVVCRRRPWKLGRYQSVSSPALAMAMHAEFSIEHFTILDHFGSSRYGRLQVFSCPGVSRIIVREIGHHGIESARYSSTYRYTVGHAVRENGVVRIRF